MCFSNKRPQFSHLYQEGVRPDGREGILQVEEKWHKGRALDSVPGGLRCPVLASSLSACGIQCPHLSHATLMAP